MKRLLFFIFTTGLAATSLWAAKTGHNVMAANEAGTGFAGAYATSKHWQPPSDPLVLKKLNRFQDLKFGFFLCWGTQTQWGSVDQSWCLCPERYDWNKKPAGHEQEDTLAFKKSYENLLKTFNPVKFNPESMAEIAEAAGTRYLVFCTKHHDGFCFWDTKTTDYKITSKDCPYHTNPNADVTRRVFDAFRSKGFWIGTYFSKPDWNTPYYWAPQFGPPTSRSQNYSTQQHPEVWAQFKEFTWAQLRELMSGYGVVDILWLDGGQVQPRNGQNIDMPGIARMARQLQPGLLMVDRTAGGGCEDFLTPEGTHAMPKQYRPEVWEACMTLGDRWGWTTNSAYHSSGAIIRYLTRAVARNGNLLLDVGPDAQGELDSQAVKVLREVGAWLKVNGEAIYNTRPIKPYERGKTVFTQKPDGTTYAIILSDKDGDPMPASVTIPSGLTEGGKSITLVGGDSTPLTLKPGPQGDVDVTLPASSRPPCAAAWALKISPSTDYRGKWIEGSGDQAVLEAVDAAYESIQPSAKMACLPLLYKRDWDGFVEGPPWPCWWIQNSFGPSYAMMPFLGEPYATWMEHSQAMWFRLMGDGQRKDVNGFQGPDGCLCDAAFFMMNGGSSRGFGDPRRPGGAVGQELDGKIHTQGIWYRQGDGNPRQHDWFMGTTAAGLILESDRLLVRHDVVAAKQRLPQLERVAAFLDTRRDPKTNLIKGAMAANLLAPSYSGVRQPDGTYGQATLTELSVNTIAGLERLAEVCVLCGESGKADGYRATAGKIRAALPRMLGPDGCYVMSEDPDGTRHGVYGAAKHGYFEATPNHDAGCFGVTDDEANRKIIGRMLSLKGAAAPGGLAPHGLIIPNYPRYDDSVHGGPYGHWVNGGHWTTTQGRMSIAALRADEFAHPFGAWARIRALMEGYRADAPLSGFGKTPWGDKLRAPYCVVYDCWGASGGILRGLFEYDYRADRLRVRPHLPAGITRYVQKFPVWFGKTKIYLTVTGTGECGWTDLRPSGKAETLAVELVRGNAKGQGAWQPRVVASMLVGPAAEEFRAAGAFYQALVKAGLQDSYEAAVARTALELAAAGEIRGKTNPVLPDLGGIPSCNPKAVETLYRNTAVWMLGGLEDRLVGRSLWQERVPQEIIDIARKGKLIP